MDGKESVKLNDVLCISHLPKHTRSIPAQHDIDINPHLRGVIHAPLVKHSQVELIIGMDYERLHTVLDHIKGHNGQLSAKQYPLGWALSTDRQGTDNTISVCAFQRDNLQELIIDMFNRDFVEKPGDNELTMSLDDKRAVKIMENSVSRRPDGHLQVALPYINDNVTLPDNYKMALQRFQSLRSQLMKNPVLKTHVLTIVGGMIDRKDILPMTLEELAIVWNRIWYVPYFLTNILVKPRVVFDARATFKNTCINKVLLQGPSMMDIKMISILLAARQHRICIQADIEKMFNHCKLSPEDQLTLRMLWFEDNDITKDPVPHKFDFHAYGLTSSPYVAEFIIQFIAKLVKDTALPETIRTLKKSFWIDDLVKCFIELSTAKAVITELISILGKFNLRLCKIATNCKELQNLFPASEWAPTIRDLDLEKDDLPVHKVLGVQWDTNIDFYKLKIDLKDKPRTIRGILSVIHSVYDPFGFGCIFILPAKLILQKANMLHLTLDETIPEPLLSQYEKWLKHLPKLSDLQIPRRLSPWDEPTLFQLHAFSDASDNGYGTGIYARSSPDNCVFAVRIVFGKSRVMPKKKTYSTPRGELAAALTSVRILKCIKESLEIKISGFYYWTDSMTVLRYINSTGLRFKKWVATRLDDIHDFSKPEQWRYVPTKLNVGDLASRGVSPHRMSTATQWIEGPQFLGTPEERWSFETPPVPRDPLPEVLSEVTVTSVTLTSDEFPLIKLVNYHSNLHNLLRAIAALIRFIRLRKKGKPPLMHNTDNTSVVPMKKYFPSTLTGFNYALLQAARIAQVEAYGCIIDLIQKSDFSTALKKCDDPVLKQQLNSLRNLRPFVSSEDGVMRVAGRLQHASISYQAKYPIILPKNGNFTTLVVEHFHLATGCSGYNTTLSATRQHFWIVQGPTTVKRITRSCVKCRERNAQPLEQVMAPLPEVRLTTGNLPFTASSVDYFGPFYVVRGRRREKRWGVIFTCLAVRAVHFEIAHSLDTSSFLNAYVRFICERGYAPTRMYSDNGTNLKGGYNELKEGLKRLDSQKIHRKLAERSVTWIFSPPSASHQNGHVERLIRSTRKILWALTQNNKRTPSDEQLLTFIKEVQSILNSRPLVAVSDDPRDYSALSPATVLTGVLHPLAPLDTFSTGDQLKNSWKWAQATANQFWKLFIKEYIPSLIKTRRWLTPKPNLKINDLVLILDNAISTSRGNYPKAIVTNTFPDSFGHTRRAELRLSDGRIFIRDIRKIALLEAS